MRRSRAVLFGLAVGCLGLAGFLATRDSGKPVVSSENSSSSSTDLVRTKTAAIEEAVAHSHRHPHSSSDSATTTDKQGVVREWITQSDFKLTEFAKNFADNPTASNRRLRLRITPSKVVDCVIESLEFLGGNEGVLKGVVDGEPGGTVVLSYVGDSRAGSVHLPGKGRSYVLHGADGGVVQVVELDLKAAPGCETASEPQGLANFSSP